MSLKQALCPDVEITPEIQAYLDRDAEADQLVIKAEAWKQHYAECKAAGRKPAVYGVRLGM